MNELILCLNTAVIKREKELLKYETVENTVAFNLYKNAINETDTVYEYTYTVEDYLAIGVTDRNTIITINRDIRSMSLYLTQEQMEQLLINKREYVKANYIEKNEYVLSLMGYPSSDSEQIILAESVAGVRDGIPIHLMTDSEIVILNNLGIIDTLKATYGYKYLNFITRRVSAYTTRMSPQYSLLYIDTTNYTVGYQIAEIYEYTRLGFMRSIHNDLYDETYEFYEALSGVYLLSSAVYTILAEESRNILEFDFTSDDILDSLYKTFSIPYVEDLPKSNRIAFGERLNRILMNKGNSQSIIDIADAFGVRDVFQYVLYKEYKDKERGYDPTLSLADNYDLFFVRAPIGTSDIHKYIYGASAETGTKLTYDDFVSIDKKWGTDEDNLKNYLLSQDFTYLPTKYIGVDTLTDLTANAINQTQFMSYLYSNKESLGDYEMKLSRSGITASLWETFIYCVVLLTNYHGYHDEIIKDPEGLVYIYGMNTEEGLPIDVVEEYKQKLPSELHYLLDFQKLDSNVTLTQFMQIVLHNTKTLTALRDVINNYTGEYHIMKLLMKIENIISTMKINDYYNEIANFDRYSEWIQSVNFTLYNRLEFLRSSPEVEVELYDELISIIEDLENFCNPNNVIDITNLLGFLVKIREDEARSVKETMFKMITFLKTYTVDMRTPKLTLYAFDGYTRILSEILIRHKVNVWSRLDFTGQDYLSSKDKYSLKSYFSINDTFINKDGTCGNNVDLPPWLTVENIYNYIREDYFNGAGFDTAIMIKNKSYVWDRLIISSYDSFKGKYKYSVNDMSVSMTTDTFEPVWSRELLVSDMDIEDTITTYKKSYENSRTRYLENILSLYRNKNSDIVSFIDALKNISTGVSRTDM